jgi:hypothetical protein
MTRWSSGASVPWSLTSTTTARPSIDVARTLTVSP